MSQDTYRKIRNLIITAGIVLLIVLRIDTAVSGVAYALGILYPFLIGFCIAFVMNIPMSFFERKLFLGKKIGNKEIPKNAARALSIAICCVIALIIVLAAIFYLIPTLTDALVNLARALKENTPIWHEYLLKKFSRFPSAVQFLEEHDFSKIDYESLILRLVTGLRSGGHNAVSNLWTLATQLIGTAANTCIAVAFAIYICGGKEGHIKRFYLFLYSVMPRRGADKVRKGVVICAQTFRRFITGQCLESVLDGLILAFLMTVAGMPYPLLIALMGMVCSFIPMFGAVIAGVFGAIMVLTVSPGRMVAFVVIYILFRIFDDNFMYPRIIGNQIGMPAVFVLVGIVIGGSIFGFGGMLIFIPLTSVIYGLIAYAVDYGIKRRGVRTDKNGEVIVDDDDDDR